MFLLCRGMLVGLGPGFVSLGVETFKDFLLQCEGELKNKKLKINGACQSLVSVLEA